MHIGQHHTIPISFIHRLLANLQAPAGQQLAWVRECGIAPALLEESTARVTGEQFSDLFRRLARELDDELPGMFSRPVPGGTLKLMCLAMLSSPNLRVALYRFTRFFRLIVDDLRVELSQEGDDTRLALQPTRPDAAANTFGQEIVLKLIHGIASWMAGRKLPLSRVDFTYDRPEHVSDYVFLYPGPAHFQQPLTAVYFATAELDKPLRQDKQSLNTFLRRAPEDWLFVSDTERIISHRIREHLSLAPDKAQSVEDVAAQLYLSVRTLSRRLRQEGTSFQLIKDELRRDLAVHALTKSREPIIHIAERLGFDDVTTFHRAFRKWTGSTPGSYRG